MANDIFNKGEIVNTMDIPEEVRENTYRKQLWAKKALGDYVAHFFGDRSEWSVSESTSHNGSLTGTQAVITKGNKQTIFMLVEPEHPQRHDVHIIKAVKDLNEGSFVDEIEYMFSSEGRKAKESLNTPFAALAGIKDKLPRKIKNPGAPKGRRFRW
ncbi:MAG: hypothetical protein ABH830_01600 [Patescibacteria group bacterium]